MLRIGHTLSKSCQGLTRRELLQVGGLGVLGLTLTDSLRSHASANPRPRSSEPSCIFIFLEGRPSQLETFDPKPKAPSDVRGPYGPIPTSVPGLQIGELLPMMAQRMHHCALIRSMTGFDGNHNAHLALTGFARGTTTHGAVITRLKGHTGGMPPYVHIGGKLFASPGVGGGVFGAACEPIRITNPLANQSLPEFQLAADIPATRFQHRRELLASLDRLRARASAAAEQMDVFHQRAADILTSTRVRDAFDLSKEREQVRSRYGVNMF